ncbi:CdaR family protein [Pseudalkalibacillus caeni]|uniref:YbbR-like domain-containing protein n=1 Tax=Exobacillus caeni TaxID=2574798 RepID=A0A5R9F3C5_9BACL|nr:CdaR family protein [Pseudalkalibacillus caeni]TLS34924.1 YbbR-like domain-containing protein [Pseudalkalibacillus caeni]
MDKLLKSNWFVKIISFLLALMLYTIVAMPDNTASENKNIFEPETETERITNMKLDVYYDEKEIVYSNLPDSVDVVVKGSRDRVMLSKLSNKEVYVDLRNLTPGKHLVKVKHKNFPDEVDVAIEPGSVPVLIEKKATVEHSVDIELMNKNKIPEGYTAEEPIITPNSVSVTGAKSQLDKIAFVRGYVDISDAKDTVKQRIPLNVYDENMHELKDLTIEPSVVDVKVPISSPYKKVPIKLDENGKLPDGVSISSIEIEPAEVTVFGPNDVLNDIQYIDGIPLELDKIKENTTLELKVPVPEGAKKVDPESIKIKVTVDKEQEVTFTDIPVKVTGLSDGLMAEFLDPKSGELDITLKGASTVLDKLKKPDIEAYVDVSELSEGEHELAVEINGPQHIQWANNQKVKVAIKNQT